MIWPKLEVEIFPASVIAPLAVESTIVVIAFIPKKDRK